ncbi:MAG: hypothetical protein AABW51_03550 [Nanoarchaeota archaeon]
MAEKFIEYLEEAERIIKAADHMVYVTFSIIKDKKLLMGILLEIRKAIINCINSILQYEHINKRITLTKNPLTNFKLFSEQCSKRFEIAENEIKLMLELFDLLEKHKQSPFEFTKGDNVIILSDNLKHEKVSIEKTKQFLMLSKSILMKIKSKIVDK